jgi:hypothetical protein
MGRGITTATSNKSLQPTAVHSIGEYEVRLRRDKRSVDLISDALPFGRLWHTEVSDAVEYAKFYKPFT